MSRRPRGLAWRVLRLAIRAVAAVVLFCLLWVLAYRVVNPPTTFLMLTEGRRLGGVAQEWRALGEMTPWAPRAAVAAEDANFCRHWGIDFDAVRDALADDARVRGASTISQQVAKNVFLWPGRTWVRKGLEAGFTVLVELTWPKRRIVEVYLNVAEMGEGVFGIEAAAQAAFGRSAADLTLAQAARIAATLPNPRRYSAARPGGYVQRRARQIAGGAETILADGRAACFEAAQ